MSTFGITSSDNGNKYWKEWKTEVNERQRWKQWSFVIEHSVQSSGRLQWRLMGVLCWCDVRTAHLSLGDIRAAPVNIKPALEQILNWVVAHSRCQTSTPSNNLYPTVSKCEFILTEQVAGQKGLFVLWFHADMYRCTCFKSVLSWWYVSFCFKETPTAARLCSNPTKMCTEYSKDISVRLNLKKTKHGENVH